MRKLHVRMELDDEVIEDDYIFGAVCNSTSVGGILTLKPETVDMSDGEFEILLIKAPKDMVELHECIKALNKQNYDSRMITFRKSSKIKVISSAEMAWSLDGEKAEGAEEIYIENLHKRIELVL